jgi:hypothetical protein
MIGADRAAHAAALDGRASSIEEAAAQAMASMPACGGMPLTPPLPFPRRQR